MEACILLYFIQFVDNPNGKTESNSNSNNNNYEGDYSIDNIHSHKDYNNSKNIISDIIESMKHQMEGISKTRWRNDNNDNSKIDNDIGIHHDFYANNYEDVDDSDGNVTGKTDDGLDFVVNPGLYDLDNDSMYPNLTDLDSDTGNIEANNNGKRRSESQDIADGINKL